MINATWDFFLGIMVRSWALDGNLLEGWVFNGIYIYLPRSLYYAISMVYIYLNIYHKQFFPKCSDFLKR